MLVTNTNPYEGNEVEEAILLVRSEVVDDVKHEVILSGAVDDVVTEVVTSDRTRRREVVELTTLELEAHPEAGVTQRPIARLGLMKLTRSPNLTS